jgi:S-DNA-T family DNA segregation ATPase FtsK/SpoIIIE
MDNKKDIERLEQKIDELSDKIEVILERQNTQYTDIMLFLKSNSDNNIVTIDNRTVDELYEKALEVTIKAQKVSTSYIQRKLIVGYSRASQLMDMLEKRGVIGPRDGAKARDVLIKKSE